jgi:drug/metabolite transporter (DMT)-like permease
MPANRSRLMKPLHIAIYLFLAVTWGFSFMILLHVVEAFGWAGAVTLRSLLSGALLIATARLIGRNLDFGGQWKHLAIVGATTVAGQLVFMSIGVPRIGTAMSSIFVAAIPLFSMVISQVWGLEQISRRGIAGIALGLAGILMLVGFPAEPVTASFLFGCACSLLAAFFAAYGSNHVSHHIGGIGAWEVTIASSIFGGLITLPLMVPVPVPGPVTMTDLGWLFVLAAVISALNYTLYFKLVAEIGATKTISVEFLVTVVAVIVGTMLLGERLSLIQFAGAAVIICGCMLVLDLFKPKEPDIHG